MLTFLRSLEHSTIIYESEQFQPLLRLAWNQQASARNPFHRASPARGSCLTVRCCDDLQDPNYLATILTDSPRTVILDIRSVHHVAEDSGSA